MIVSGKIDLAGARARRSFQPASKRGLVDAFGALVDSRADSRLGSVEIFTAGLSRHKGQTYRPASTQPIYSVSITLSVVADSPARDRIVEACRARSLAVAVGGLFQWSRSSHGGDRQYGVRYGLRR
jgi:hypothetical protein